MNIRLILQPFCGSFRFLWICKHACQGGSWSYFCIRTDIVLLFSSSVLHSGYFKCTDTTNSNADIFSNIYLLVLIC